MDSERLLFKELRKEDVSERYLGWLNDPAVNQFLETRFTNQTRESCEKFVSDMEKDPNSHLFGIFDKVTLEHIGNIKLGFIKTHHQSGQLSLFIGEKSCWGKGYATESIRCITKWGFDVLKLERIEAGCYDTNMASLRIFLKVGFSVEGYLRNSVVSDGQRIGCFWMGIIRNEKIK
ncbi:MAG: GNAT family N-acetyltransferase [Chloroflexi bacterium]|nr:GNAT family N-acetyltransferase [Chloroflexota bacterium]